MSSTAVRPSTVPVLPSLTAPARGNAMNSARKPTPKRPSQPLSQTARPSTVKTMMGGRRPKTDGRNYSHRLAKTARRKTDPHQLSQIAYHIRRIPAARTLVDLARLVFRTKCVELNLPFVEAREERFIALTLKTCSNNELAITNANVGAESAWAVCQAVENFPQLFSTFDTLDLSGNPLGDTGAAAVARILDQHKPFVEVKLNSTNFTSKGFELIFDAVSRKTNMQRVHMSTTTTIGNMYVKPLAEPCSSHPCQHTTRSHLGHPSCPEILEEGLVRRRRL